MKNVIIKLTLFMLCIHCGVWKTKASAETVSIDWNDTLQRFDGWGTSLCWWAVRIGDWSKEDLNSIVALITDPDTGLGLNIFRYNIGGGDNPSHKHMRTGGNVPGYKMNENDDYNWNADPNQRAVLECLITHCPDILLEAFSNSPPWWMTKSGCTSGNTDGSNNLKDDYYDDFAGYLVDVVQHFHEEWGITFSTLEPLNESEEGWWKANGSQEGCHFDRSSQEKIIQEIYKALTAAGLEKTIKISADDANSIDACLANLNAWSSKTLSCLGRINTHSYNGSKRAALRARADALNLPLYQSESGPLGWSGNSVYDAALFMSRRILSDLYNMQAQAWIDWQLLDDSQNWQLISTDWKGNFSPGTNFFPRAAFSRFIRPGWSIIETNNVNVAAAVAPKDNNFGIVVLNDKTAEKEYAFTLQTIDSSIHAVDVYRTTKSDHCLLSDSVSVTDNSFTIIVPGRSLVSIRPQLPHKVPLTGTPLINRQVPFSITARKTLQQLQVTYPRNSRWMFTVFRVNGTATVSRMLPAGGLCHIDCTSLTSGMYLLSCTSLTNGSERFIAKFSW